MKTTATTAVAKALKSISLFFPLLAIFWISWFFSIAFRVFLIAAWLPSVWVQWKLIIIHWVSLSSTQRPLLFSPQHSSGQHVRSTQQKRDLKKHASVQHKTVSSRQQKCHFNKNATLQHKTVRSTQINWRTCLELTHLCWTDVLNRRVCGTKGCLYSLILDLTISNFSG